MGLEVKCCDRKMSDKKMSILFIPLNRASLEGNYRKGLFKCQETKNRESLTEMRKNDIIIKNEKNKLVRDNNDICKLTPRFV